MFSTMTALIWSLPRMRQQMSYKYIILWKKYQNVWIDMVSTQVELSYAKCILKSINFNVSNGNTSVTDNE